MVLLLDDRHEDEKEVVARLLISSFMLIVRMHFPIIDVYLRVAAGAASAASTASGASAGAAAVTATAATSATSATAAAAAAAFAAFASADNAANHSAGAAGAATAATSASTTATATAASAATAATTVAATRPCTLITNTATYYYQCFSVCYFITSIRRRETSWPGFRGQPTAGGLTERGSMGL